jgi:AAA domain-containing protein
MDSSTVTDHDPPDKPDFSANHADSQPNSPNGHGDDEGPWSPSLLDLIAEAEQVWLCHDQEDADLLLRPDAGDVPALWLPRQGVHLLTSDLVKPLTRIYVLQRPDDVLGDGFYAGYGEQVKQQLEGVIDGPKTLYRVPLNEIVPTLAHLWASPVVLEDRQRFQFELVNLQQSGLAEELRPTRRRRKAKAQGPRPIIVHADQVEAQPILWLWKPYIPRGMVVMLDGDPGLGKGLMLIQMATNLSRAWPFLDQVGKPILLADVDGPQTTLILSAEESIAHVMIPRLERAGADRRYIKFLTGWLGPEDEERAFDLSHLGVLIQAIEEVKPVLVILDPLVAYLGDIDMYKATQTRPLMARLKMVAERHACTILGVRHPGKSEQAGRLMYRGQGNMDIIGAARSGLWVQPHPTHPDTHTILLQSKSNVGMLGHTMVFTREDGNFAWQGVSRLTESMLTGKGPDPWSMLEAFFWLEETMKPGLPYRSAELEKDADKQDISLKVLKRAKKLLGVKSYQRDGSWYCRLPPLSLPTTTTTTTTRTTGGTGATGATGTTGDSDLKSITYDEIPAEDPQTPASPVDPRVPSSPSDNTRAREEEPPR